MCGCLADLQSIDKLFDEKDEVTQINLNASSDFLGVIRKLEKEHKVVFMPTKLYPMVK